MLAVAPVAVLVGSAAEAPLPLDPHHPPGDVVMFHAIPFRYPKCRSIGKKPWLSCMDAELYVNYLILQSKSQFDRTATSLQSHVRSIPHFGGPNRSQPTVLFRWIVPFRFTYSIKMSIRRKKTLHHSNHRMLITRTVPRLC